ncbi:hypothetical protein D3C81_2170840 [compost metagenome]
MYEAGLSAAMGNVHRTLAIDVHVTGDEKGVRLGDHGFGRVIQFVEVLGDTRRRVRQRHGTKLAQLDVLRAIAKGLLHRHPEAVR